eukprot:TRINITY_DN38771_c0_g1_i3.p1 TRINITY_DN38771_c0_g1~~TRINITY_DN38771_c0_g1_i3.p1  ORF type:complete len:220 (-),score=24.43 TRINITY_DN38771_c0_g1_i3:868-1527(-)
MPCTGGRCFELFGWRLGYLFLCVVSGVLITSAFYYLFRNHAELICADAGSAYCASDADMSIIDTAEFSHGLDYLRHEMLDGSASHADSLDAIRLVVSSHFGANSTLSPKCLNCQANALDCSLDRRNHCRELCMSDVCSRTCRQCIAALCSVRKACGGKAGRTIQKTYTCPFGDGAELAVDKDADHEFIGQCLGNSHKKLATQLIPFTDHNRSDFLAPGN